ncbi:MAG: hypothetical protein NZ899_10705 [Thermoguttaceae bacterium]|nr:hypothetical protein [Thermoguttaceae bacterium]MDW8078938.1 hypothetical protein [Thermoguttaceae bacterium]
MSASQVELGNQVLAEIVGRLRREVALQPAKAAVLGVLLLVAAVIWGPRLTHLMGGQQTASLVKVNNPTGEPGSGPAGAKGGSQLGQAQGTVAPVKTNAQVPGGFPWIDQLERFLSQASLAGLPDLSQLENPFRPAESPVSEASREGSCPGIPSEEPTGPSTELARGGLQGTAVAQPLPVVRAVVISKGLRAAVVDNRLLVLEPGQPSPRVALRTGEREEEFELTAIEPGEIVLRKEDRIIRLPVGSKEPRIRIDIGGRPATASHGDHSL